MKTLPRFTFGMGDRFGHQGEAQLKVAIDAQAIGYEVYPIWNKSMREHTLIGTNPSSLRDEVESAVKALDYHKPYFVDADHINLGTVDGFIPSCDFFTFDVADDLGAAPKSADKNKRYYDALVALETVEIDGVGSPMVFDEATAEKYVQAFGGAIESVAELYAKLKDAKGTDEFAVEVSMDETDEVQGPRELLAICRLLALEEIPAQTIAPKFSGRFNKGVDYVGDLDAFKQEFEYDALVLKYASVHFGLPETLKLSVHSGSDKFSLYPVIRELVAKHGVGLHLKTAGTTWLEEVIGLASAGGEALEFIGDLYEKACGMFDELVGPYATVLDVDREQLLSPEEFRRLEADQIVRMVTHDSSDPLYDPSLRQFLHVAFKLASKDGDRFYSLLKQHADIVNKRVYDNLFNRHLLKVFPK